MPGSAEAAEITTPEAVARDLAKERMRTGALWCLGGLLVTGITYAFAASSPYGGTYVVALGAIIYGAAQFGRGWSGKDRGPSIEDLGYEALERGTRLEAEGCTQEALTVYQEVAGKYPNSEAARDAKRSMESLREKLG